MLASPTTLSSYQLTTETLLAAIVRRETPNSDIGSYGMLWFSAPQSPR
jgi:hypothetical protein